MPAAMPAAVPADQGSVLPPSVLVAPLSRRGFLFLSALLGTGALTGCDLFGEADGYDPEDLGTPFRVWEELRAAVRTSPDHVAAAAERAVAGKDPEAILAFVRDQIAAYPPAGGSADLVSESRWGVRGTLRGGAGSARDKVEVLAELYRRAGFTAEVVYGDLADGVQTTDLFRSVKRTFAPRVDEKRLDAWREVTKKAKKAPRLPGTGTMPGDPVKAAKDLARQLAEALPAPAGGRGPRLSDRSVPLVKVVVKGEEVFANPLVPGAKLGDAHTTEEPNRARAASTGLPVTVRLLAATTADPTTLKPLVAAEYRAADLVGRQLHVAFRPTTEMAKLVHAKIQDLGTFVPVLNVAGPGLDAEAAKKLATAGPAITLTGQVIEAKGEELVVDGVPLSAPVTPDPRAGDRVAKLEIEANSSAFPDIAVRVRALDATGKDIPGLPASAFGVTEGETALGFRMTANQPPPPRVMLVFDRSGSIDTGPEPVAFARELARRLFARNAEAAVGVMAVSGNRPDREPFALRTPEAVGAAVGKLSSVGSDIWAAIADANAARPSVIVMASDFDPTDRAEDVARLRAVAGAGVPVVAIGIGAVKTDKQQEIAALTGGLATAGADFDKTVEATDTFLRDQESRPYQLRYRAPADGAEQRTVTVTAGKGAKGTARYQVPAKEQRTAGTSFAGMYLGLKVGYEREVVRVLAGLDQNRAASGDQVPEAAAEEVRGLMFGSTMVSFEGAAPSLSAWLDDLLTARLGVRPLAEAAVAKDEKRIVAALEKGVPHVPPLLPVLHPAWPAAGELTYETSLRAVLHIDRPQFGVGRVRRADVLPVTAWTTLGEDRRKAFDRTLERSALLAVAEAAAFPESTLAGLRGKKLTVLPAGRVSGDKLEFAPENLRGAWADLLNDWRDYHRVVPADGTPVAFWAVEPDTGSVLGILGDGSGGGAGTLACEIFAAKAALSLVGLFGGVFGIAGLGGFVALGKAISAQMLRYAYVIENLDNPNVGELAKAASEALYDEARSVAADVLKPFIFDKVGAPLLGDAVADAIGNVDGILDVADKSLPVPGLTEWGSGPPDPNSC
jgi:hypothetical protein